MTPARWQEIDELLGRALDRTAADRPRFLDGSCGDDRGLRRELERLLALDERRDFLDESVFSVHAADPDVGRRIGPYETRALLGRGGMGAVYLAVRQDDYTQQVALKLIKRGMDSDEILRRFAAERQILADLDHPNVARLLDGGTTDDGRPFLVMEYVEGEPLDRYCDDRALSVRRRLELFLDVCSAVELAHRNLVVHRDLKPGNILVGKADGIPKLLDFGVAKLLEPGPAGVATALGRRPMTLHYASPEQVRGQAVTTASDVYSLGVVLYQLLTGRLPNDLGDPDTAEDEKVRRITEQDPRRPSTMARARADAPRQLARRLAGDLDAIVLKALRKEPGRRYGSVEQLAEDLRRHLAGRPVTARAGTLGYRAGKFARRHRRGLTAAVLALIALASMVLLRGQALDQRERAVREHERVSRVTDFLSGVMDTFDPDQTPGELTVLAILDRNREEIAASLADEPRLQADLLDRLGAVYRKLGFFEQARDVLEESLSVSRRHVAGDEPEVALRLNNLGVLCYDHGDEEKAVDYLRQAIEMRRRLGQEGPESVRSLNNLATLLMHRGELAAAEELYRRGVDVRIRSYGLEHPYLATSLRSLGNLYWVAGDFERAEPLLRRALEIRRAAYGPGHTEVAAALDKLASVLDAVGRGDEAEAMWNEALAVRRTKLGRRHVLVARTQKNLAEYLLGQGEPASAAPLLEAALATFYREKPAGDWERAEAEGLLGAYWARLGHAARAGPCLETAYATLAQARGEQSIYSRKALRRLRELAGEP
jgi:serine/threonine-protein kinase